VITWLADVLRAEGLVVHEHPGWKTWGRPYDFGPPVGVVFHHTASACCAPFQALTTVHDGRLPELPGPLCHVLVGRNGEVNVVAAGYANHAGLGGPWKTVPKDSGNRWLVGVEVENNGVDEGWDEVVLDACDKVFGAILKHLGKDASWCLGHKEWAPDRKIDPKLYPVEGEVNMDAYRTRLAQYMAGSEEEPVPPPVEEEEDDMVPPDVISKWEGFFIGVKAGFEGADRPPADDPSKDNDAPYQWAGLALGRQAREIRIGA
jgi:hypothetical protein